MKSIKPLWPLLGVISLAGCSTTNLAKVIHELKSDPATVEFQVMSPGWAVSFKRAWPTNAFRGPVSTFQVTPQAQRPPLPPVPVADPGR